MTVIINYPSWFGRKKTIKDKTHDLLALTPDNAKIIVQHLTVVSFYTYDHLDTIFAKANDAEGDRVELGRYHLEFIVSCLENNLNALIRAGKSCQRMMELIAKFAKEDDLITVLSRHPKLARSLSIEWLVSKAEQSPKFARYVLTIPESHLTRPQMNHIVSKYPDNFFLAHQTAQLKAGALDIFFSGRDGAVRKQSRENIADLIHLMPRYMTLLGQSHVEAMFALVESDQEFTVLFAYLTSHSSTAKILKNILAAASVSKEEGADDLSLTQVAHKIIRKYVYEDGVLFTQENKNAYQFISRDPEIGAALYKDRPEDFAKHLDKIVGRGRRLDFLRVSGSFINCHHLLHLNLKISNPNERKAFFYKGKKDKNGKTPLKKLREGIDALVKAPPISDEDHRLLLGAFKRTDMRAWIDLARNRRSWIDWMLRRKPDETNYVGEWLKNSPKTRRTKVINSYAMTETHVDIYDNDDIAQMIALDKRLLRAIRGRTRELGKRHKFALEYANSNPYLKATDLVKRKIRETGRYFKYRRYDAFTTELIRDFIDRLNHNYTLEGKFEEVEDRQAVCWYIVSNEHLMSRLINRKVNKTDLANISPRHFGVKLGLSPTVSASALVAAAPIASPRSPSIAQAAASPDRPAELAARLLPPMSLEVTGPRISPGSSP